MCLHTESHTATPPAIESEAVTCDAPQPSTGMSKLRNLRRHARTQDATLDIRIRNL